MTQTPPDLPMRALFEAQHQASRAQPEVDLAVRLDRVARLRALIEDHTAALCDAVGADFGVRSQRLTEVADFFVLRSTIGQVQRNLARWMKPRRVSTPWFLKPAQGRLMRQPLGVIGVVAPWNYPLQLSLGPAVVALAAGNRVMLKPSELTPHTSALLHSLVSQAFGAEEFCVVQGGVDVAQAFVALPFDHLFFTGSTAVGRQVAAAAAANLTPTTLELGGKSPCIIDASADLDEATLKIVHGKLLNAGQTCIAPDYLLLPRGREAAFETAWQAAVARLFPTLGGNPDYPSIISDRHHARLQALITEVREQGARVVEAAVPDREASHLRQMRPVLVFDPPAASRLMQEEIFGPILPVLSFDTLEQAVDHIGARPRPLALYWFGNDLGARDHVLGRTLSGGVTVNDTLLHITHDNLPFGGVGESGWGAYHGEMGFLLFSHQKPVMVQSRFALGHLFYPPYGARFDRLMGLLRRWL